MQQILPVSSQIPVAMVPVNGRPVVGWILDELYAQGLRNIVLLIGPNSESLVKYVTRVYTKKLNIKFVTPDRQLGVGYSVLCAAPYFDSDKVLIVLGDTIFKDLLSFKDNWLMYSTVEDTYRWCMIETDSNNNIKRFVDKPDTYNGENKALVGIYHLCDSHYFFDCLKQATNDATFIKGEIQLSSGLEICPALSIAGDTLYQLVRLR